MKKLYSLLIILLGVVSCGKSSELNNDFNCGTNTYGNLEKVTDFKKNFSIHIPKTWKTNYYYDNVVSSIYSADTTLSLTKTTVIDASFVLNPIELDENFATKVKQDNTKMELKEVKSKLITFNNKPAYYNLSQGKKTNFDYRILNVFIKDRGGFIHVKTEIYGDEKVEERLCKAVNLINGITLE